MIGDSFPSLFWYEKLSEMDFNGGMGHWAVAVDRMSIDPIYSNTKKHPLRSLQFTAAHSKQHS